MKNLILIGTLLLGAAAVAQDYSTDRVVDLDQMPARAVVCLARNARGEIFRRVGEFPEEVQERAMRACRAVSARCVPLGCQ